MTDKTILVVDDDPAILEMIFEGLVSHGFNVIPASNPDEAMDKLKKTAVSFALLDLDLNWPGTNGIELGRRIQEAVEDIIVIIMTGYHNLKECVDAMRNFSFDYMIKPFRTDQVVSLLERSECVRQLSLENKRLQSVVQSLEQENEKLKDTLDELSPEDPRSVLNATEKARMKKISQPKALKSYESQKERK